MSHQEVACPSSLGGKFWVSMFPVESPFGHATEERQLLKDIEKQVDSNRQLRSKTRSVRQGMKDSLKNLLWLLVLIACALPVMPVAVAHLRLARPSTQGTPCNPNLQIERVTYLGKSNGKDNVQVIFNGLPPTASSFNNNVPSVFSNPAASSCAKYGVLPINNFGQGGFQGGGVSNNISVQQGFAGGIPSSQGFGYELTVTITRRFGHQDTGTAKSNNIFSGTITTVVQIPRGAAETDPVKYDVTINTTFGGLTRRTLVAQGNGAPALASATQTFANSRLGSSFQNFGGNTTTDNCFPSVSITGLSFTPGSGATPDAVTIDWTASRSPSDCLTGPKVFISVEVKRPDNSTGHGALQPSANSITVNLSGAPAAPVSFIVRVSAETSLGQQFQVNKKGEF